MRPLAGLVLTLVGTCYLGLGSQALIAGRHTVRWAQTPGVVRRVWTPLLGRRLLGWLPAACLYQYTVDGILYEGTKIRYGAWLAPETRLRYAQGNEVVVHYDPVNPAKAVLEPGVAPNAWVELIVGGLALASGLYLGFF
jgi:uncharacterized protein DUF3592